jgi:hypothetical protein
MDTTFVDAHNLIEAYQAALKCARGKIPQACNCAYMSACLFVDGVPLEPVTNQPHDHAELNAIYTSGLWGAGTPESWRLWDIEETSLLTIWTEVAVPPILVGRRYFEKEVSGRWTNQPSGHRSFDLTCPQVWRARDGQALF